MYASACAENKPQKELDFTPLRVDYLERFSAAGMTSGSYTKRVCRLSFYLPTQPPTHPPLYSRSG